MFKDKKAREAIAQVRFQMGFGNTYWDSEFPKDGPPLLQDLDKKINLIIEHLGLRYERSDSKPARLLTKKRPKKRGRPRKSK
jgi:hypothetical protein